MAMAARKTNVICVVVLLFVLMCQLYQSHLTGKREFRSRGGWIWNIEW